MNDKIDFSLSIEIEDIATWMDGGSVTLQCRNKKNQEFEIEFVQHVSLVLYEHTNMPGRMYLNKKLVNQRSELENEIIEGLTTAKFKSNNFSDRLILEEKLNYVRSEKYLTDQEKIKIK